MTLNDALLCETDQSFIALQRELPALIHTSAVSPKGVLLKTSIDQLRPLALCIRNSSHLQFRTLVDVSTTDYLEVAEGCRFMVNYLFLSTIHNQRLILQLPCSETTAIPTLTVPWRRSTLFPGADWLEREV